ncbi:hypothetical protein NP493_1413g00033 [Ridgeia piscesae]|uniref:Uncharacterized protein n=1 Tax=Ridgeia piscesae TaxID=27915 RepID=A0AAD9K4D7_RIDPI|nr:hypothetical protein NP493_1413g00033 [Ridgeia piscesae]
MKGRRPVRTRATTTAEMVGRARCVDAGHMALLRCDHCPLTPPETTALFTPSVRSPSSSVQLVVSCRLHISLPTLVSRGYV